MDHLNGQGWTNVLDVGPAYTQLHAEYSIWQDVLLNDRPANNQCYYDVGPLYMKLAQPRLGAGFAVDSRTAM